MVKTKTALAALTALAIVGCIPPTRFTGSPKIETGPRGCWEQCQAWGMDLAGMVKMGDYSDGCICQVRPWMPQQQPPPLPPSGPPPQQEPPPPPPHRSQRSPPSSSFVAAAGGAVAGVWAQMQAEEEEAARRNAAAMGPSPGYGGGYRPGGRR